MIKKLTTSTVGNTKKAKISKKQSKLKKSKIEKSKVEKSKVEKAPLKSQPNIYNNAVCVWDFRINENQTTQEKLEYFLRTYGKRWIFQLEQSEKTNYKHYQGRVSLIKRKRKNEIMKIFKELGFSTPNYLEPTSTNSYGEWFYVMKEETQIKGPWKDTDEIKYVPKHVNFAMQNPYPFQEQIIKSVREENNRTVNVIYDKIGCAGKTTVAAWLCTTEHAILIPLMRTCNEIIQFVCSVCIAKQLRNPSPIFIDLPRAMPKHALQEIYSAVEILKNGLLYDTRFTAKRWNIESPAIWIFTNVDPDPSWLSEDRWKIWIINKNKELEPYIHQTVSAPLAQY